MPKPPRGFHPRGRALFSLKRAKVRQSWHKINLYHMTKERPPIYEPKTYFQQKWKAKSLTRAYHGQQVREKKWQRMFRPRLAAVVPMSHQYLARHDGSEQAAGRGSGLRDRKMLLGGRGVGNGNRMNEVKLMPQIPYMQMVYAPFERRLDTAIHRALFASSIRQSRQFVLHGSVKVNGKKMRYPGYLLNPGDMFQVEPDLVLYATGAKKSVSTERKASRIARGKTEKSTKASIEAEASSTIEDEPVESESQKEEEDQTHSDQEPSTSKSTKKSDPSASPSALLEIARAFQLSRSSILTIEDRFEQRRAQKHLHNIIARSSIPTDDLQSVDAQLAELTSQLTLHAPKMLSFTQQPSSNENHTPTMSAGDRNALKKILQAIKDNPADDTKTYGTPWRPRDYMSAFTFIPRFLEVNQKICAAVYLRHPVARPGSAEVPSPYGFDSQQLAFNWYLRRR